MICLFSVVEAVEQALDSRAFGVSAGFIGIFLFNREVIPLWVEAGSASPEGVVFQPAFVRCSDGINRLVDVLAEVECKSKIEMSLSLWMHVPPRQSHGFPTLLETARA